MQSSTVGPWVGKWGGITVDGGYLLGPRSLIVTCTYVGIAATVPVQYLSKLLQNMLLVAMLTLAHITLLSVPADM